MKKKILFMSETVTMSHLIRPLKIASSLNLEDYEVHFAATKIPAFLQAQFSEFNLHSIEGGVSEATFLKCISRGTHPYTEDIIRSYVERDLEILNTVKPDLVLGDMRLSLKISCQLAGVPYINLSNSTWDASAEQELVLPEIPIAKFFGHSISQFVFRLLHKPIMQNLAKPFNAVAKAYGLKPYGSYQDVLTSGDFTIYNDLKSLVQIQNQAPSKLTVGALIYAMAPQKMAPMDLPEKALPRVLLSLGSSGPSQHLQKMVDSLAQLPIEVVVITSGKSIKNPNPKNVWIYSYAPIENVMSEVDLVIFNGGSGMAYIALSLGIPLFSIPSNIDQHHFSQAIQRKGVGEILRSEMYTNTLFIKTVKNILSSGDYRAHAQKISLEMKNENPIREILQLINSLTAPNQPLSTIDQPR